MSESSSNKEYEELLEPLPKELSDAARWIPETGQRLVVLFEGRDTAGKGGSIDMFAAHPQSAPVPRRRAARARPSASAANGISSATSSICRPRARSACSTAAGTIAPGSSRSWAFARRSETDAFLARRAASSSGTWSTTASCCSNIGCAATRRSRRSGSPTGSTTRCGGGSCRRSISRRASRYDAYTEARERMLAATHTDFAPWTLVDFNDQRLGRLTLLRDLLDRLPDTKLPLADIDWPPLGQDRRQGALRRAAADHAVRHRQGAARRDRHRGVDLTAAIATIGRSGLGSARSRGNAMSALDCSPADGLLSRRSAAIVWLGARACSRTCANSCRSAGSRR